MTLRLGIIQASDRLLTAGTAAVVLGSVLAFGGAVWWYRPAAVVITMLLVVMQLVQHLLRGRMPVFKSPLTFLWILVLGLGLVQLAPLPATIATTLAPRAHDAYVYGVMPDLARRDDPDARVEGPESIRTPATIDRSATLRWLVGASMCLGVFWTMAHYVDRLKRLYLVWGCIAAGFMLNAAFAVVQISGQADGIYGLISESRDVGWAPSAEEFTAAPGGAVLQAIEEPVTASAEKPAVGQPFQNLVWVPRHSFLFGAMPGGSSAFLALGAMALPLSLGIVLHVLAPRGSRENLASRLGPGGQGSLAALLVVMLVVGAFLVGMMAGRWFCLPFLGSLLLVGLLSATSPGSRGVAFALTAIVVMSLTLGVMLNSVWPVVLGGQPPIATLSWETARMVWKESAAIFRDFPLLGTGFGSFPVIYPYYKSQDLALNNPMSSLLRYGIEGGATVLFILVAAGLWCLWRLPACIRKVGSADRALVFGLIGAVVGFAVWSSVNWTMDLPAVAFCASALCGTWNRWLAGGTDLFVERV